MSNPTPPEIIILDPGMARAFCDEVDAIENALESGINPDDILDLFNIIFHIQDSIQSMLPAGPGDPPAKETA